MKDKMYLPREQRIMFNILQLPIEEREQMYEEHLLVKRIRQDDKYKASISRALFGAFVREEYELVDLYLSLGANPSLAGSRALIYAAEQGLFNYVVKLHSAGGDVKASDSAALIFAARNGHSDIVFYLASKGADVQANNNEPLIIAAEHGHADTVKWLLWLGADVKARDSQALIILSKQGMNDVIKYALNYGADPKTQNSECMVQAISYNHLDTAEILYQAGAELTNEVLIEAIWRNNMKAFAWLREKGIDIHANNNRALKLAKEWKRDGLVVALESTFWFETQKEGWFPSFCWCNTGMPNFLWYYSV